MLALLVAQIATRMYGYPSRPNNDEDYMQLLPIFDMANCADQGTPPHDMHQMCSR